MLATVIDLVHALAMVVWIGGFPLLVWRRHPRWTRSYAVYALAFVVLSQVSQWMLGECFLTTFARWAWEAQPAGTAPAGVDEWFTVRLAHAVFGAAPSHRTIVWASEAMIVATSILTLRALHHDRVHRARAATAS